MQLLLRLRDHPETKLKTLLFTKNDGFSSKCSLRAKPREEGKRTVWIDGKTDARSVDYSVQRVYDTAFNIGNAPKTILPGRRYGTRRKKRENERERVPPLEYTADGCGSSLLCLDAVYNRLFLAYKLIFLPFLFVSLSVDV